MKNLLITGANGMVGRNIQNVLKSKNISGWNILTPSSQELNLLNEDNVQNYFYNNKPHVILHLAAVCAGILGNAKSPADFITKNLIMGTNIYNNCQHYGKTKKVYSLGSVCSYPVNCPIPFKEEDLFNGRPEPTNEAYGESKRALLIMSQSYRYQYNLGGAFFMPVNMFGLYDSFNESKSHVIPALIKKFVNAAENNLPEVMCHGTGVATREFLFAGDCAEVIIDSIFEEFDHNEPINLGTGMEISIKNLAELIARLTNYNGQIVFNADQFDGQPKRCLDVSRAKKLLNWAAKTSLEDGLIKTINWYKANR